MSFNWIPPPPPFPPNSMESALYLWKSPLEKCKAPKDTWNYPWKSHTIHGFQWSTNGVCTILWLRAWDTDRCGSCALVSFLINHPSMLPYPSSQCICSFPTVLANAGRTNASRVGSSKLLFFTPKVPSPPLPPTLPEKGCFSNSSHPRRQSQSPVASGAENERFGWTGFSVLCCC